MTDKSIPDAAALRQLLRHDQEAGKLFWRPRPMEMFSSKITFLTWNSRWAGRHAGYLGANGYLYLSIFHKRFLAHRVIWAIFYGDWPNKNIDHINGSPTDNRISNLRLASQAENCRNSRIRRDNKTGVKGVSWHASRRKFIADICVNGVRKRIGYFDTKDDAEKAYLSFAEELHGDFALHNRNSPRPALPTQEEIKR